MPHTKTVNNKDFCCKLLLYYLILSFHGRDMKFFTVLTLNAIYEELYSLDYFIGLIFVIKGIYLRVSLLVQSIHRVL